MKFTQYISPWHDGYRTKTIIDRAESKVWMVSQESGAAINASTTEAIALDAASLSALEAFLASTCERHDHN
jgi:hypothetical protein